MWGKSRRAEDYAHIVMTFMPDILNFETDFSFHKYQFWHLEKTLHSLHCKVIAWISTYIVIVGYGSYRSSKGELWVFFFLSVFFCIFHILSFSVFQCGFFKKRGKERKNPMKPIFSMITSNMISTNLAAIDPFDVLASYYRQSQDVKFYFVLF